MTRNLPQMNSALTPSTRMMDFPASELAEGLGLTAHYRGLRTPPEAQILKNKLVEVCTRCTIRFGLPDQARQHISSSILLPNEPVLLHPHKGSACDSRWETLATALIFSPPGHLPIIEVRVSGRDALRSIKESLPSLLEDIGLLQRLTHRPPARPTLRPITKELGDSLVSRLHEVASYGDKDLSEAGYSRAIGRNIERQMRIYATLGPAWTLITPLESIALSTCVMPDKKSIHRSQADGG